MYSKKRNQADGHLRPSSAPPKRPSFAMQHPEAESIMTSLDSDRNSLIAPNFSAHADHNSAPADRKYSVVAIGKRSCAYRQQFAIDAEEECPKRSRSEHSDATVSGVTFQNDSDLHHARIPNVESDAASVGRLQNDSDLHHARIPNAESDAASVERHVGSCHDSVCLNSRKSTFVARCSKETDVDMHGIRHKNADKHVTFISSREPEFSGSMLSATRQAMRDTSVSTILSCRQSRDCSHGNSRNSSFPSHIRDLSQASPTHGQEFEAGARGRLVPSKHVIIRSPQIIPTESRRAAFSASPHTTFFNVGTMRSKSIPDTGCQHAAFLNADVHAKVSSVDTMHSKVSHVDPMLSKESAPSYVLSSGRLCLDEEARLGRRLPTIDDDFEEYFSSLML